MTEKHLTEQDILASTDPEVDQLGFLHVQKQPLIVCVASVTRGPSKDKPVQVNLEPHPRFSDSGNPTLPYRPCKGMRRILVEAWGSNGREVWPGRSMELVGNPAVTYGGVAVGGVQISKLSHMSKPLETFLVVSRGKRIPYRVDVLASRLEKSRAWLAAKGLTEADAVAAIGGRKLEDATDEDWATLRAWAAGATESKGQPHG